MSDTLHHDAPSDYFLEWIPTVAATELAVLRRQYKDASQNQADVAGQAEARRYLQAIDDEFKRRGTNGDADAL